MFEEKFIGVLGCSFLMHQTLSGLGHDNNSNKTSTTMTTVNNNNNNPFKKEKEGTERIGDLPSNFR